MVPHKIEALGSFTMHKALKVMLNIKLCFPKFLEAISMLHLISIVVVISAAYCMLQHLTE